MYPSAKWVNIKYALKIRQSVAKPLFYNYFMSFPSLNASHIHLAWGPLNPCPPGLGCETLQHLVIQNGALRFCGFAIRSRKTEQSGPRHWEETHAVDTHLPWMEAVSNTRGGGANNCSISFDPLQSTNLHFFTPPPICPCKASLGGGLWNYVIVPYIFQVPGGFRALRGGWCY